MRPYEELSRGGQVRRMTALARRSLSAWGLDGAPLRAVHHFHNTMFKVGDAFALRVARPGYQSDDALRSEVLFLEHLARTDVPAPVPVRTSSGEAFTVSGDRRCVLFRWIDGRRVQGSFSPRHARAQGELTARLHDCSVSFAPPSTFERRRYDADTLSGEATGFPRELVRSRLDPAGLRVIDAATELVRRTWDEIDDTHLVHGDIMPGNTVWSKGRPHLIDFDDMAWAPLAYDLGVVRWAYPQHAASDELWEAFLEGYASIRELPTGLRDHLDGLIAGRRVLVALWLAGNMDHPSFSEAKGWVTAEIETLRGNLAAGARLGAESSD